MSGWRTAGVLALAFGIAHDAGAIAPGVAVFPVLERANVGKAKLESAEKALAKAVAAQQHLRLVVGAPLRAALGEDPLAALRACGKNLQCLATLGKTAGASYVVLGQIAPAGRAFTLSILVLDVETAALRPPIVVVAQAGSADRRVAEKLGPTFVALAQLPKTESAGSASRQGAPGGGEVPMPPLPPDRAAAKAGSSSQPAPPEPPSSSPRVRDAARVSAPIDASPAAEAGVADRPSSADSAAVSPIQPPNEHVLAALLAPRAAGAPSATDAVVLPGDLSLSDTRGTLASISYKAIAILGAVGVGAMGIGAYCGVSAQAERRELVRDGNLGQITASRRNSRAEGLALLANLLFASGGIVTLAAGGALGFNLVAGN